MYWKSVNELFMMGGYGLYVWVSFGVTFVCMMIEVWLLGERRAFNKQMEIKGNTHEGTT